MIVESAVIVVGNKYDRVFPIGSAANRIHYLRDKSLSSLYRADARHFPTVFRRSRNWDRRRRPAATARIAGSPPPDREKQTSAGNGDRPQGRMEGSWLLAVHPGNSPPMKPRFR